MKSNVPVTEEPSDSSETEPTIFIYASAVISPDGYDWRQDSTFGAAGNRLALFRNGDEILSLDTGREHLISSDPDCHHIINGHLYTEYTTDNETVIKRDGDELFRFLGKERMKGMIPVGDCLYTLGQDSDGDGFSLRLDGSPLFVKEVGTVCGGFNDCNYDRAGALYYSFGNICFDYYYGNKKRHVRNGVEKRESDGICSSRIDFFNKGTYWYHVYPKGEGEEVGYMSDGTFSQPEGIPEGSYYYFPTEGGCYFGNVLYLALTPREKGKKPFIWTKEGCTELDINGFLSGVDVL